MLPELTLVYMLATTSVVHPMKITGIDALPTPFMLGNVTVACELKYTSPFRRQSAPGTFDVRPRFSVRIEDNLAAGSWNSGWIWVPTSGEDADGKWTARLRASYRPDSALALRVSEITVTAVVDDGSGKLRERRRYYFRWMDGLFHSTPDYAGPDSVRMAFSHAAMRPTIDGPGLSGDIDLSSLPPGFALPGASGFPMGSSVFPPTSGFPQAPPVFVPNPTPPPTTTIQDSPAPAPTSGGIGSLKARYLNTRVIARGVAARER